MLWETLDRVNRLRQQALSNPDFAKSAKAHQKALEEQSYFYHSARKTKMKAQSEKALADIYKQVDFGINPTGTEH